MSTSEEQLHKERIARGERLCDERKRLGLSQQDFAQQAGVQRRAQINYEAGDRSPDADYLAAISAMGVSLNYVILGQGEKRTTLTADEEVLLDGYRRLDLATRRRTLAFMLGGDQPTAGPAPTKQITVTSKSGQAAGRDIVNNGGRTGPAGGRNVKGSSR